MAAYLIRRLWQMIPTLMGVILLVFFLFKYFGGDPAEASAPTGQIDWAPQMVSPQARVARTIEETRQTSSAEVTIKDQTGRAEVTRGSLGPLINLQPSGAF